jgi:hypothetical protein
MSSCKQILLVKGLSGTCLSVWGPLPSYAPIPPFLHSVYMYSLYSILIHSEKGVRRANQREGERGNSSQRLDLQSINSDKHLPQSPSTNFLDDNILLWFIYCVVNKSTALLISLQVLCNVFCQGHAEITYVRHNMPGSLSMKAINQSPWIIISI